MINIPFKTDRPKTEFWNSSNVELARDLAQKLNLWWTHITGQAHHNKVKRNDCMNNHKLILKKDWADGEFARIKDKLRMHLTRHKNDSNYIEVKDSASFCEFGVKYLEKPGPRASIEKRTFYDLKDEIIKERKDEVRIFNFDSKSIPRSLRCLESKL